MLKMAYDPDTQTPSPEPARWRGHQHTSVYFSCPVVDSAYDYLDSTGAGLQPAKANPLQPEASFFSPIPTAKVGAFSGGVTGSKERSIR